MKLFLKFVGLLMVLFTAFVFIRILLMSPYTILNIMGYLITLTTSLFFLLAIYLLREELKILFGDKPYMDKHR